MLTIKGGTPEYDLLAPLITDADVRERVDQVISYDARRGRSLWLMFLAADGVQLPVVVPIEELPAQPGPGAARCILDVAASVINQAAPGGSTVITIVRDNGPEATESEQRWLMSLHAAAARTGARIRMFCLATTDGVSVLKSA